MLGTGRRVTIALCAVMVMGACGGGDGAADPEPTAPDSTPTESPAAESPAADIVVLGTDSLEFQPSEVEASAGTISVALTAESAGAPHTFTVELDEGDTTVVQAFTPGEAHIGEIELEAGTYIFYCAIAPHRDEGMEGTLTVS